MFDSIVYITKARSASGDPWGSGVVVDEARREIFCESNPLLFQKYIFYK